MKGTGNHEAQREPMGFEAEYMGFRKELESFLFRLVCNRQDVEDLVQDTYLKSFAHLDGFQGKSSLKTWVFTIALNLAKNHLKRERRWVEQAQDIGASLHMHSPELTQQTVSLFHSKPDTEFEIREHISYCFTCIGKTLVLPQQVCLLLKEIYDFKVSEIMEITGMSEGKVKHALADARKHMIRIFDNRCAFVNKQGVCHQCTSLKGVLNPLQDAQAQANEIKLVKEGDNPDREYLLNLRIALAKSIDPLHASNTHLHAYFLENLPQWVAQGMPEEG